MKIRPSQLIVPSTALVMLAGVAWANSSTSTVTVSTQVPSPAASVLPSSSPVVTVNGTTIPMDNNGSATVAVPTGETRIDTSNGQTVITTTGKTGTTTNKISNQGPVNVTVDQSKNSDGNSWSTTTVSGGSFNSNFSSSSSSTNVYGDSSTSTPLIK
jgi:hypothetical protein